LHVMRFRALFWRNQFQCVALGHPGGSNLKNLGTFHVNLGTHSSFVVCFERHLKPRSDQYLVERIFFEKN
jgi:hypothetical protein